MTGSNDATATTTSETMAPSHIAGIACRLVKLGSRKCARKGRVPPSGDYVGASSPRGLSMGTYAWPGGTRKPSVTSLKWWIRASID